MNLDKDTHSISWTLLIVYLNIPSTNSNLGGLAWLKHIIYIPSRSLDDGTVIIYLFPRNINYLILQFHTSHEIFKHSCLWNPFLSSKDSIRPMCPWMALGSEFQLTIECKLGLESMNRRFHWTCGIRLQLGMPLPLMSHGRKGRFRPREETRVLHSHRHCNFCKGGQNQ